MTAITSTFVLTSATSTQGMGGFDLPLTITLTSDTVGRKIELSSNNGVTWYDAVATSSTANTLVTTVYTPITNFRATGDIGDILTALNSSNALTVVDSSPWRDGVGDNLTFDPVEGPDAAPTGVDSGIAGNLNGTYQYMCTYVTGDNQETEGRVQSANVTVTNKKVNVTGIPVSSDNRVTARRLYRKPASASADVVPLKFVVEIADNTTTTYVDDIADGSLGVLINRINDTGGSIYFGPDRVFHADRTNLTIGWDSGFSTGYAATAVGIHCLTVNEGQRNTAVGMYALNLNTTGNNNTGVGVHALAENTTGIDSTAMGYTALENNTTGPGNVAIGNFALRANLTAGGGTCVGYNSGANSTGGHTTAMGYQALMNVAAGVGNTAVGYKAGLLTNAAASAANIATCTLIGEQCTVAASGDVNSIVIGSLAQGAGSNTVVIGSSAIVSTTLQGSIILGKTVTAGGTTGAQTINKPTGTVNFAAAAGSLVVTNSLVTANSIIQLTVGTNDATMKSALAVASTGSFTIFPNATPTAETRVNFTVTN